MGQKGAASWYGAEQADDAKLKQKETRKVCYWKSAVKREFLDIDLADTEGASRFGAELFAHPFMADFAYLYTEAAVESWEKGLLFIGKKFVRVLDNGVFYFWNGGKPVEVKKVDMREVESDITGQEIMTRDKVPLRINFFLQYRVKDCLKAVLEVKDMEGQLHVAAQVALRDYVGTLTFDELTEKKESVGSAVIPLLKESAEKFGITLGRAGIKDIYETKFRHLPGEIRDIMNQVLIATKKAEANVITRREETASTRSLLNTAKIMEDNAVVAHLKELEYIERIADKVKEINIGGGGAVLDRMRELFVPEKKGAKAA
jgi:regulator of protease activity HflC (stomatin/prohibitin superfamily)